MRKTKIVCTLGPASHSEKVLSGLIGVGMDMARLNYSRGTHEGHAQIFPPLRRLAEKAGDTILVGDGYLRLCGKGVEGFEVHTRLVEGGILKSHRGINLSGIDLSTLSATRKDREDLAFGLSLGVDYVGCPLCAGPNILKP